MAESSTSQYEKILQAHWVNTKKYWLVKGIENYCIVTWVGEILPEPSGNSSGSAFRISLGLRQYFIINPSSRHNTVTVWTLELSIACYMFTLPFCSQRRGCHRIFQLPSCLTSLPLACLRWWSFLILKDDPTVISEKL